MRIPAARSTTTITTGRWSHPRATRSCATSTTRWRRVGAPCRVPEGWPGDVPAEADADGGEILTIEDLIVVGTDSLSTICCTSPTCAVRLSALKTAARPELEPRS